MHHPWLILLTFLLNGNHSIQVKECYNISCIYRTIKLAEHDPNIIRYQVLQYNDKRVSGVGMPFEKPIVDMWKQ